MEAGTLIDLVRGGWLTLTFAMLLSRFLFQAAGAVRMRAFLDQWQQGRAKRWWGAVALAYAAVLAVGAVTLEGELSGLEWALLVVLVGVLVADGLVNVLPAGFRTFKDSVQEAWVRRRGGGGGDERLFLAGNVALGVAAAGMAALVIAYAPIALSTIALALALSVVIIGALVGRRV